jgi:prepilin-type N-terminal cleavage/methylation domain-containing protein
MSRLRRRLRLRSEGGYSLVEMLTVLLIMGIVMGGLTTLFVQGSNAEVDMNARFQAQTEARVGLDRFRRDAHTACAASTSPASGAAWSITLTFRNGGTCSASTTYNTWCTRSVGGSTTRFALYRVVGSSSCGSSGGTKYMDYLTPTSGAATCGSPTALCVFTFTGQSITSLASVHVDLPVNARPTKTVETYEVVDDIVLRNSCRVTGACTT